MAVRLLEFLTEKLSQDLYGKINFEFPINPSVPPSGEVKSWGEFKEDSLPISKIAIWRPMLKKLLTG